MSIATEPRAFLAASYTLAATRLFATAVTSVNCKFKFPWCSGLRLGLSLSGLGLGLSLGYSEYC